MTIILLAVLAGVRARGFYVHVIYYGKSDAVYEQYQRLADAAFRDEGPKWNLITRYNKFVPWFQCQYVWYPDDDLKIAAADVAKTFRIADDYRLLVSRRSALALKFAFPVRVCAAGCC